MKFTQRQAIPGCFAGILVLCGSCFILSRFEPDNTGQLSDSTPSAVITSLAAPSATPAQTPTPRPSINVGEPFNVVGELTYVVESAESRGSTLASRKAYIASQRTPGKFILVRYLIKNDGRRNQKIVQPTLLDHLHRTYSPNNYIGGYYVPENESCHYAGVDPGFEVACTDIFEVPIDAVGLRLTFRGAFKKEREAVINLGLDPEP